jgi:hypothetical protein
MRGWWLSHPSEKYESQLELLFPMYGKIIKCFKPPTRCSFFDHPVFAYSSSDAVVLSNLPAKVV